MPTRRVKKSSDRLVALGVADVFEQAAERDHLVVQGAVVDDTVVVTLVGELDMVTSTMVSDYLNGVADGRDVLVDLTQLDFLNAAGASALVSGKKAIEASGGRFTVRGAAGIVRRVLAFAAIY